MCMNKGFGYVGYMAGEGANVANPSIHRSLATYGYISYLLMKRLREKNKYLYSKFSVFT
jgi:hypothetical protein